MVLLLPLFTGGAPKTDADGNVVEDSSGGVLAKVTVGVRYTAFVLPTLATPPILTAGETMRGTYIFWGLRSKST